MRAASHARGPRLGQPERPDVGGRGKLDAVGARHRPRRLTSTHPSRAAPTCADSPISRGTRLRSPSSVPHRRARHRAEQPRRDRLRRHVLGRVRPGRQVTLTAAPASGSRFLGWSGACTGRARAPWSWTMRTRLRPRSAPAFALSVSVKGPGRVTSHACGHRLPGPLPRHAARGRPHRAHMPFRRSGPASASWSGACKGRGRCSVTMNATARSPPPSGADGGAAARAGRRPRHLADVRQ